MVFHCRSPFSIIQRYGRGRRGNLTDKCTMIIEVKGHSVGKRQTGGGWLNAKTKVKVKVKVKVIVIVMKAKRKSETG